jgi:hypothetical protein
LEDLSAKRAALKGRSDGENIPDFSKEAPNTEVNLASASVLSHFDDLEATARDLSAVFRSAPEINKSEVMIRYSDAYTRLPNSTQEMPQDGGRVTRTDVIEAGVFPCGVGKSRDLSFKSVKGLIVALSYHWQLD